ncbi:hypothetical protein HPB51_014259 [Rhipicephalus microplus]|uniref:CCHC-type domain-containing protein n=1 Tax=Rhipicephalus microplus TaxID=6941 RepID=A0A9J6DVC4_RHIMP|nr:hypothetical protein HPB51_014259 [Rhipicephalus microplus]
MQVSVDGEDITPDDLQDSGWSVATTKRKLRGTHAPRTETQASVSMHGDAWSPQRSRAAVKKRLIAASRLPYLTRDHHRVIVRPRNGLDMRTVSQIKFAKALAALSEEEVTEDVVCPNMMQNIAVISTPAERNARAYSKITAITLGTTSFDVSAYGAAPDDTCKGIIRGVDADIGQEQLYSLIVHPRNPTALQVKRIKNSTTVIVLFDGLKVPNYVICGNSLVRCTLYRRQTDVCYACGKLGHRADVCPHPEEAVCRGCGMSSPSEGHVCTPECKLCGGPHLTADKTCKHRFQVPYIVRRRRRERRMQYTMEFAEQDADDMNSTDSGGDFLSLPAAAGGRATTERPSSSWRPRDVSQQLQPPRGRSRSRGRARGRSRSRGHSRSKGRSNSRVPTVRNGVQQGNQHQTWASKIKGSQPQVKGGTNPEQHSDIYAQMQRENANLRAIVEQLRAEIADLRKSQQVSSPSPSNTVPCTEATSDASHDDVPMDVHPGAKPTKRRALAQPANNEDRDFKTEVKETLNDIKNALRAVVESIAVLDSRVTKIEADQGKALQSAEATSAQVIPKVRIVQKVATRSVSQERAFEGPNNGGTP